MSSAPETGQVESAPDTAQVKDENLYLLPTVSWPRNMVVGRRHLVEVDLAFVTSAGDPATWPLDDEEECAYTCALESSGDFDVWAVHDACVVLHRFDGSYGPAEFIVTPREKTGRYSLWLGILNPWGVQVGSYELDVDVRRPEGGEIPPGQKIPADVQAPVPGGPAEDGDLAEALRMGDLITLELALSHADLAEAVIVGTGIVGAEAAAVPPEPDLDDTTDYADQTTGADRTTGDDSVLRLAEWYKVAGLRRSPSGTLHWDMLPLFYPGAASGTLTTFTVHCAPSDEHGTVFAVISEPPAGAPPRDPQLLSVQSAKIPPGIYQVTAELLNPHHGYVRFHGLPLPLRDEPRRWPEIAAGVPDRLTAGTGPVHLITAIEISGPADIVARRIDCVQQLVEFVTTEAADFVCYSVISYGPHSINPRNPEYPEIPSTTLVWAEMADSALAVLARLSGNTPGSTGYTSAAQLECVLADLEDRLTGQEGRPVLVTVGGRPAHPPHVDQFSQIIPCPRRNDWRDMLSRMRARYAGITVSAIHDTGNEDELWRALGTDDTATLESFYAPDFANAIGLTSGSGQLMSIPMFAGQESAVTFPADRPDAG